MPIGTGRAIFGGMHNPMINGRIRELVEVSLGTELIYSFVIILCSLIIYFSTKELYELSNYKGIKYFRMTFLFFAIAYFFRSFIKLIVVYFGINGIIDFNPFTFGATGLVIQLIFIYFSTMAVFYLLYSLMYKKWENSSNKIYLFHGLAVMIALIGILFRNSLIYLLINLFLLVLAVFIIYTSHKKNKAKKKGTNLYIIYVLLSIFWVLNILDTLIPSFFAEATILIYLASVCIFILILYKVIKQTGN